MAYNFTDEDKAVTDDFQERIPFGVSEVVIVSAKADVTEAGKDFIELTVQNAEGLEDSARKWFTGGASPYSFQAIRQIIVHTADDKDKEKARLAVENTANTEEMVALINKMCIGKQIWFTKFYSPDRTYTNQSGETKRSIDNNVYGYEPKDQPNLMPEANGGATANAVTDTFPGATEEASSSIPAEDAWGK
jgi:hypothetical protein